jgi:formylglycine-generating enzyme required for sulfatase activity
VKKKEGLKPEFEQAPARVNRGGSWYSAAGSARAAYRGGDFPGYRSGFLGLRLVRDESPIQPEHRHRSEHEKEG